MPQHLGLLAGPQGEARWEGPIMFERMPGRWEQVGHQVEMALEDLEYQLSPRLNFRTLDLLQSLEGLAMTLLWGPNP